MPKKDKKEEFPKPSIKKRSIKDIVSVCPVCFHPTKYVAAVFGMPHHICTDEECGWSGTIAIEVSLDDYMAFVEKRKLEETSNEQIDEKSAENFE